MLISTRYIDGITVEHHNFGIEISTYYFDYKFKRIYSGYTEQEALERFLADKKKNIYNEWKGYY